MYPGDIFKITTTFAVNKQFYFCDFSFCWSLEFLLLFFSLFENEVVFVENFCRKYVCVTVGVFHITYIGFIKISKFTYVCKYCDAMNVRVLEFLLESM